MKKRGLANVSPERRLEIAKMGGRAVAEKLGRAHMSAIGKVGGNVIAMNKDHMAAIGKKGGSTVAEDVEHMRRIGQKGGLVTKTKRDGN